MELHGTLELPYCYCFQPFLLSLGSGEALNFKLCRPDSLTPPTGEMVSGELKLPVLAFWSRVHQHA